MQTGSEFVTLRVATARGEFIAHYSERGLAALSFPGRGSAGGADRTPPRGVPSQIDRWHRITSNVLTETFAGREPLELPPLDLRGTAFQKSVWNALKKIPRGETKSYRDIAVSIGRPQAVRAVGGACAANPVPILVPCHRVLAADKKLGGFSAGVEWKRILLSLEQN
jgi:O6-methylguanine-DNA--protein-cysteine methyltransferase